MLFNSIEFLFFLPIVFILYWKVFQKNIRTQNAFLLFSSYVFYGWWDWRFLGLIAFSTLVDYQIGRWLATFTIDWQRKMLLWVSLAINLGLLCIFKYYNFFIENFAAAFTFFGTSLQANRLNIILPVGISFYTFQTLSYSIDVYRKKIGASNDIIAFGTFVSFFPQLVAGPIERATHLLPQFLRTREFKYQNAIDGLKQILVGLFKKIVIADSCAQYANLIFNNYEDYSGSTLLLGAIFFTFQIYGDFSGYSDIAIGTSKLFGFNLMKNFAYPYFSRDIAEFWRRWHISLSTWFRDYLYIPLGGSKGSTVKRVRNIFIIFIVSGFWHGANWTFIIWGALNAIYFLPLMLLDKNRINIGVAASGRILPSHRELLQIGATFLMTVFAWIFFRAENVSHAVGFINQIFSSSIFVIPYFSGITNSIPMLIFLGLFLLLEWIQRNKAYALEDFGSTMSPYFRWSIYFSFSMVIYYYSAVVPQQQFIYFQF